MMWMSACLRLPFEAGGIDRRGYAFDGDIAIVQRAILIGEAPQIIELHGLSPAKKLKRAGADDFVP
jgi:hypothetical protein